MPLRLGQYELIGEKTISTRNQNKCIYWLEHILAVTVVLGVLTLSFFLGRMSVPASSGSQITVRFMPDDLYNPPNRTLESDVAWNGFPTGGYIVMDKQQTETPTLLREDVGGYLYTVSGFHQVHCLAIIRNAYYLLLQNGSHALEHVVHFPHHPNGANIAKHVTHCFDYLRQNSMCHADRILEPFVESDGFTVQPHGSSGWGVNHQCNSWDELVEWVDGRDARQMGWEG